MFYARGSGSGSGWHCGGAARSNQGLKPDRWGRLYGTAEAWLKPCPDTRRRRGSENEANIEQGFAIISRRQRVTRLQPSGKDPTGFGPLSDALRTPSKVTPPRHSEEIAVANDEESACGQEEQKKQIPRCARNDRSRHFHPCGWAEGPCGTP